MKVWKGRDTGGITIFENEPVKSEVSKDGFFYLFDPVTNDYLWEVKNPTQDLIDSLELGESKPVEI